MTSFEYALRLILGDSTLSEDQKVKHIMDEAEDYYMPRDAEMWDS